MESIKVKQVEGAVDLSSDQTVDGSKSFQAPQYFTGGPRVMALSEDAIYWCQTEGVLDEPDNSRLKMQNGQLVLEVYDGGNWIMQ